MADDRTCEEIDHDRVPEERAAPYAGRTLTEAERADPAVVEILDRARGAMERRLGLPPGVHRQAYLARIERRSASRADRHC